MRQKKLENVRNGKCENKHEANRFSWEEKKIITQRENKEVKKRERKNETKRKDPTKRSSRTNEKTKNGGKQSNTTKDGKTRD